VVVDGTCVAESRATNPAFQWAGGTRARAASGSASRSRTDGSQKGQVGCDAGCDPTGGRQMTTLLGWAALITAATSLVAIVAAVVQITQLRKRRRRDFEDLFVQRYWSIMDRLSLAAVESNGPADGAVAAEDRLAVMAYLRLCEDELDLRTQRWVSADTWELWRLGIASQLRRWPFDAVWTEVSAREAS
jgi:hypothetical protein